MREKLIELLIETHEQTAYKCDTTRCDDCTAIGKRDCWYHLFADILIAHGVTIQDREEIDFDYEAEVE